MRAPLWAIVCVVFATAKGEIYNIYDATTQQRFGEELHRLGVALPTFSEPDEQITNTPDPTASSPAGTFIGYWQKTQFGRPIAAFEGIPYAQPPVGSLRFKVCEPLSMQLTNFTAKSPGSLCTQRDFFHDDSSNIIGTENCLFVNVYVPEKTEREDLQLLPVMFWIHGGGFQTDGGHNFQSNIMLDKDVVLVTINYRLAALGFLSTEDEVMPGNIGLKDQVAALKWVHQNIRGFGGDPNLVTVIGHSAGGAAVEFLMLSPLTKGLIHRVIAMSGSALAPWATAPPGEMQQNVRKAAQHLECPDTPSQMLWECLQNKTAEEIIAVDTLFGIFGPSVVIPFKPVIEGNVTGAHIPRDPAKLFSDGPANDVPYLSGVTSEEGLPITGPMFENETIIRELDENYLEYWPDTLLLTRSQRNPEVISSLRRAYLTPGPLNKTKVFAVTNIYTDILFLWPAIQSMQYHWKGSKVPSYLYYFNFEGSRSRSFSDFDRGVSHSDDLLYLFNYTGSTFPPPSPSDVLMSMIWTDMFTSFARDGVPSSSLVKTQWLAVTTNDTNIEHLHVKSPTNITMKRGLRPERWLLLKTLLERG